VLLLNVPRIYHANALLGLAAVAENRGNWDQADENYNRVIALSIPSLTAMARARQDMLPTLARPVVFAQPADLIEVDTDFDDFRLDFSRPLDPEMRGGGAPVLTVPED